LYVTSFFFFSLFLASSSALSPHSPARLTRLVEVFLGETVRECMMKFAATDKNRRLSNLAKVFLREHFPQAQIQQS